MSLKNLNINSTMPRKNEDITPKNIDHHLNLYHLKILEYH